MDLSRIEEPTLVTLAQKNVEAAGMVLEQLKNDKKNSRCFALHCLSLESGNSQYLYGQISTIQYLDYLIFFSELFTAQMLRNRLSHMFVEPDSYFKYRLKAFILFKHFVNELTIKKNYQIILAEDYAG